MHEKPGHQIPHRTRTLGMYLFLATLTMLFGASMTGYYLIRIFRPEQPGATSHPALGSIHLPPTLWISTAIILFGSFTIHRAVVAVQHEKQHALQKNLTITCGLAILFILIQCPSLLMVLRHQQQTNYALYGLVFFLILLHALHVIGGIIGLFVTTMKSLHNQYDHEHHTGVKNAAIYWHFLDGVWLVMFLSMWFIG